MKVAPTNWVTGPLGKVAPLQRGFDLPTSRVVPGKVPVVYSNGVGRWHNTAMLKGPGVVTGRSGTIGRVHFVDGPYWPHNTSLWVTDFSRCVARFTYYLLQAISLERFAGGSGVPTLNRNDAHSFEVSVPADRDEQVRIAEALSDVDDLIAALRRLISKKEAIKQGLVQQLITGKTRLPGFTAAWRKDTIGHLCSIRSGKRKQKAAGGRYWIVDMGSVTRDAELVVAHKSDDSSDILRAGELVMPKDDIGGGNIIGRTGLIERDHTYVLADHVYALTPQNVDPAFMNFAINSYQVNSSLRSKVTGSAQLGLSRRGVLDQSVSYPNETQEQRAIANVITDANREIELLRARHTKAIFFKGGMMQELLTGRTRFPVEEVPA